LPFFLNLLFVGKIRLLRNVIEFISFNAVYRMRGTAYSGYIYGGGMSKSQRQKKLSKRELIF
jgi:hypothetical protein